MIFYTNQHKYYCGIDLHARRMNVCIIDGQGEIREHRNMKPDRDLPWLVGRVLLLNRTCYILGVIPYPVI